MKKIVLILSCFLCLAKANAQSRQQTNAATPVPLAGEAQVATSTASQAVTTNAQVNAIGVQVNADAALPVTRSKTVNGIQTPSSHVIQNGKLVPLAKEGQKLDKPLDK